MLNHQFRTLITGATSGIGEALAWELAKKGKPLLLTGRRKERLEKLKASITSKFPISVEISTFDIRHKLQIDSALESQKKAFSELNVLVNNAGLSKGIEPMAAGNWDDWEAMIDTNIKGLLYLTRKVLPILIGHGGGHVVNMGSVAGRWVYPGGGVYCATKFAVRAISEAIRMDHNGKNIRVTNIEPGMVNTEFSLVRFDQDKDKAAKVYEGIQPLSAQDIAETIVWCLERPAHVNIQELVIYPTNQASVHHVHRDLNR